MGGVTFYLQKKGNYSRGRWPQLWEGRTLQKEDLAKGSYFRGQEVVWGNSVKRILEKFKGPRSSITKAPCRQEIE